LPIVTQLNGEPRVTEEGDIVYIFPEMQVSAATSLPTFNQENLQSSILKQAGLKPNASSREIATLLRMNGISTRGSLEKSDLINILQQALPPISNDDDLDDDEPDILVEKEYKFSLASDGNRFLAAGLGVLNFLGAVYLGGQLNFYANYGIRLPAFFGIVQAFYPLLLSYAIAFNVIPLVRSFWIQSENAKIQDRNRKRRLWKTAVQSGFGRVTQKLQAARRLGTRMKKLSPQDIFFDTSTPIEELDMAKRNKELDEFDKLLGN
jgi:hypothetical protein